MQESPKNGGRERGRPFSSGENAIVEVCNLHAWMNESYTSSRLLDETICDEKGQRRSLEKFKTRPRNMFMASLSSFYQRCLIAKHAKDAKFRNTFALTEEIEGISWHSLRWHLRIAQMLRWIRRRGSQHRLMPLFLFWHFHFLPTKLFSSFIWSFWAFGKRKTGREKQGNRTRDVVWWQYGDKILYCYGFCWAEKKQRREE